MKVTIDLSDDDLEAIVAEKMVEWYNDFKRLLKSKTFVKDKEAKKDLKALKRVARYCRTEVQFEELKFD